MIVLLLTFATSSFVFATHSLSNAFAAHHGLFGSTTTISQSIAGWAKSSAVSLGLANTARERPPDTTRHKANTRKACVLKI